MCKFACHSFDTFNLFQIIKVDVETKQALTWCEENCYPSEPIFVENPNAEVIKIY